MSEIKGMFGRAAKFVHGKASERKDALERRSLVKNLTALVNLRQHTSAIENEFGVLLTRLPMPDELGALDLDALRDLCPKNAMEIVARGAALEHKRIAAEQHADWAEDKIRELLNPGGNLYINSLKDCGITRAMLRPEISRVSDLARARGGVIGGSNATAALISVEDTSLQIPVALIPEAERRYLIAFLYLSRFAKDESRVSNWEWVNGQMLAVMIDCGAIDSITNNLQHEVLANSLPGLLRSVRMAIRQDIVQMRQYAQSGEAYSDQVANILSGGEPDLNIVPDVSGFRSILHPDRNEEALLALADRILEEETEEQTVQLPAPVLSEPEPSDEAVLEAALRRQRDFVFDTGDGVLFHSTRGYAQAVLGIENPAQDLFERRMAMDRLSLEWPHKEDFEAFEAYRKAREAIEAAAFDLAAARSVRSLGELLPIEKLALFVVIALREAGNIPEAVAIGLRSLIAWGNGKCDFEMEPGAQSETMRPGSRELINEYLSSRVPDYEGEIRGLIQRGRELAANSHSPSLRQILGELLASETRASEGAGLRGVLEYLPADRPSTDAAVYIGLKEGQPVTFRGDESLLTIGAPGTGKTQGQVIPTLMTGTHSMVVLDIKGELLKTTQRDLEARGVRVLQFSLIDGHPGAHGYNPMTYLPNEPKGMWRKAAQMSEMLLPDELAGNGPWLANARTLLTCHACAVKLERGEAATLKDVMRSIKGGIKFVDGEEVRGTPEDRFNSMLDVAEGRGFHDLADEVASLSQLVAGDEGAAAKMWQSILLGVRPLMDMLMADEVREATERSDWTPTDLRTRDTRLFIQVRAVDLDAYKPLLRLIIGQHLQSLMEFAGERPDMPVTFLLDELPQLGNFPEVLRAIEVGRSARVRVWGFVQDLAQIHATYAKAGVLINSPAVTSFLSFDTAAAEHLVKLWGMKHDVVRDQRVPAVDIADFFKPDMDGKMVCVGRGAQPVVMDVAKAHELFTDRLG